MSSLKFTLVSEGSSDRALLPILTWAIRQHKKIEVRPQWADLRRLPRPPKTPDEKIRVALELHPCELLFIHRDADGAGRETRVREIGKSLAPVDSPPAVCVVPVRMLEAWLLFDEQAIRQAAGNPNGSIPLHLPRGKAAEKLPKPKEKLHEIIRIASELEGRKLLRINRKIGMSVHRIVQLIRDFSPLRELPAFTAFEEDLEQTLARLAVTTRDQPE